mmetsp:Transcript_10595/g.25786  ORF Transcript_10595/g.25786 Transcript_10595/m.25786 type:complete len:140 (+) Transcript_10595:111-530(+)
MPPALHHHPSSNVPFAAAISRSTTSRNTPASVASPIKGVAVLLPVQPLWVVGLLVQPMWMVGMRGTVEEAIRHSLEQQLPAPNLLKLRRGVPTALGMMVEGPRAAPCCKCQPCLGGNTSHLPMCLASAGCEDCSKCKTS